MIASLRTVVAVVRRGWSAPAFGRSSRTSLVTSAIGTSLLSKVGTLVLQFGALPVAARSLGGAGFGAYIAVSAAVGWISLGSLGVGPAVTTGVARAVAAGDVETAKRFIATGTALAVGTAGCISVMVLALVMSGTVRAFLGPQFAAYGAVIPVAFVVIAIGPLGMLAMGAVISAQSGLMEQYRGNLWTLLGIATSAVVVVLVSITSPTLPALAAAISIPLVAAATLNVLGFFRRHPALAPSPRDVRLRLLPELASTGAAFLLLQFGGYLSMNLTLLLAARSLGPSATGSVGVVLQMSMMLGGLIVMITQPLWPALLHAKSVGDMPWARSAYRTTVGLGMVAGIGGGSLVALMASPTARLLYGGQISISQDLATTIGVFFVASAWAHVHSWVVVGLGSPLTAGVVQLVESSVSVVLVLPLVTFMGPAGVGVALGVGVLSTSAWILPVATRRMFSTASGWSV